MLIYTGEGEPIVERVRFTKGRDIRTRILNDLDNSIQMMQYIAPEARLNEILQKDSVLVKQAEFFKTWERLYPGEAQEKMESYYQKVYVADQLYKEGDRPGWQTDRGKIFILYGAPESQEVEISGKIYKRWTYPRWSLSFLFEERNQNWILLE